MTASRGTWPPDKAPFDKGPKCGATLGGNGDFTRPGGGLEAQLLERIICILSKPNASPRRTQRSYLRYAVLAPALLWRADSSKTSDPIRVQLTNISRGGIGLLAGSSLDAGVPVAFEMTLEGIGPIQWKCLVRWCLPAADDTHRIGAQLVETDVSGLYTPESTDTA